MISVISMISDLYDLVISTFCTAGLQLALPGWCLVSLLFLYGVSVSDPVHVILHVVFTVLLHQPLSARNPPLPGSDSRPGGYFLRSDFVPLWDHK